MSAPMIFSSGLCAWCQVTGATGAIVNSIGVTSVTRNGAGDYTVVLSETIDAGEASVLVTNRGVANGQISAIMSADGTVAVHSFNGDGSAATDKDFALTVLRVKAPS